MLISVFMEEPNILDMDLSGYNYRYINGKEKNRKHCAGYCNCDLHCGALTDEMVDKHRCLEKECYHFYAVIDEERM